MITIRSLNNHFNVPRTAIAAGCAALAIFFIANIEELSSIATTGGFLAPAIFGGLAFVAILACVSKKNIKPKSSFRGYYSHEIETDGTFRVEHRTNKPQKYGSASREFERIEYLLKINAGRLIVDGLQARAQTIHDKFLDKIASLPPYRRLCVNESIISEINQINIRIQKYFNFDSEEVFGQLPQDVFEIIFGCMEVEQQRELAYRSPYGLKVCAKQFGFKVDSHLSAENQLQLAKVYMTSLEKECHDHQNSFRRIRVFQEVQGFSGYRLDAFRTLQNFYTLTTVELVEEHWESEEYLHRKPNLGRFLIQVAKHHQPDPALQDKINLGLGRTVSSNNLITAEKFLVLKGQTNNYQYEFRTPLEIAVDNNNIDMVQLLLSYEASFSDAPELSLERACFLLEIEALKRSSLKMDGVIDKENQQGFSLLCRAAHSGDEIATGKLLQLGANPNVAVSSGWTPLAIAILFSHTPVIHALLLHAEDRIKEAIATGTPEALNAIFTNVADPRMGFAFELAIATENRIMIDICKALRMEEEGTPYDTDDLNRFQHDVSQGCAMEDRRLLIIRRGFEELRKSLGLLFEARV